MTITPQDLVRREVHYCVSSLVHTLAKAAGNFHAYSDHRSPECGVSELTVLAEQAFELAAPIPDYKEAAREAGAKLHFREDDGHWCVLDQNDNDMWDALYQTEDEAAQRYCEEYDIEPYDREVFEHWIVSDWLADKLAAKGEKVDKDFGGLTVWARTTTGQAISVDWVIEQIVEDLNRD